MLAPFPVVLAPYDRHWSRLAHALSTRLAVLGGVLTGVHHIGSTSVPGLVAKPIIDLLPVVTSIEALDALRASIEALGYAWHGEYGIATRRFCTLSNRFGTRIANVHFFAQDSSAIARHLAFRDYLIAHPAMRQEYALEKRRAQSLHANDSDAYTDEKAAWISSTEARALLWAEAAGVLYTPP